MTKSTESGYYYLASPYSDMDKAVEQARYESALLAFRWLISKGRWTFSPIVQCHDLAKCHGIPGHFGFWQRYNRVMLLRSSGLIILMLDSWQNSKGVKAELAYAKELQKDIQYMLPIEAYYKLKSQP